MASKKVLIVSYYWPPAGGPGVQRWLKFVKYLPDYDIDPIVYVPENPTYPIIDQDLVREVSQKATIVKQEIFEPYRFANFFSKNKTKKISSGIIPSRSKQSVLEKIFLWVRGNLFIPDARAFWVKPSIKFLTDYIIDNNIDTIITTGPPHSLHLIGLSLKNSTNVKWIADFRDPWTTIGYHKSLKLSSYAAKIHETMEHRVLNAADTVLVTSRTTKKEFELITTKPIEIITNGFDNENVVAETLDTKFSLAHIGSFLSERNPKVLWEALSELVKDVPDFNDNLEIKLIGAVSQEVLKTIDDHGLSLHINNYGYLPHKEAISHQLKSQVLLLIEIDSDDTKSIIPGKLFEYLISRRPIIAIGPKGSDFAEIIEHTNTGTFFHYDEKAKLKDVILEFYSRFLDGNLKSKAVNLEQYSRRNLTEKLVKVLSNL